jgi:hypothetical protein
VLIGPIDLPWQQVPTTIELYPSVEGTTVRVLGATDLPDGAVVDWLLWRDDADIPGLVGAAEVRNGEFSFARDLAGQPRGPWILEVRCSTVWGSEQPEHVLDVFGSEGEHFAGSQVFVDSPGDAKLVLVTTSVVLR